MTSGKPIFATYAARYAQQGFAVFPLARNSKVPPKGSHGVSEATTDPKQIAEWSRLGPCDNIGLATGAISKITVVDVDPLHHGFETERAFRAQGKVWPNTPVSRTRSGGRHLFFDYHPGLITGTNRIGQGIDIRNDGGYVVAAGCFVRDIKTGAIGKYSWMKWLDGYFAPVPPWAVDHFEAEQAAREAALAEKAKNTVRVDPSKLQDSERRRYEGLAAANFARYEARLAAKCKPDRNTLLYTVCGWMRPYVEIGVIDEAEVRSAFEAACHTNEVVKENGIIDVRKTMDKAFREAKDQLPDLSKLKDRPYGRAA